MDDAVPLLPPWVILCRIPRRVPGGAPAAGIAEADADAQAAAAGEGAEHEAGAEHAADFSFPLVVPPRVTVMNAGPSSHPDPNSPDMYPYVLGAESGMLLLNFGVEPFYGVCLDDRPYQSNLIVVREFDAAGFAQGRPLTGTAERIAPRGGEEAVVTNLESVGLVSTPGHDAVHRFLIAELLVNKGSDTARLVYIFADHDNWSQEDVPNPLLGHGHGRVGEWVPSGVICRINMLWWFDLSWGLISFNHMAEPEEDDEPLLRFHALPEGRVLDMAQPGIQNTRCIAESTGELLFVEIINDDPDGDAEAARVCVWTRTAGEGNVTIGWAVEHNVGFQEIWNHDSYITTGLPRKVPVLVAVSPVNVDHVYFVLQQEERLFCADLLTRTVAEFVDEDYDLVTPWPVPPSCRYILPWIVPLVQVPQDGNLNVEEVVHIAEGMANDEEEMQEEVPEEGELALLEQLHDDAEEFIVAAQVILQALVQGQAAEEAPNDDEELQEADIDDEEQPEEEIDDEEQLEAEIQDDDEEQPEAEIDDEEQLEAEIQDDDEEQPEAEIDDEEQLEAEIQDDDEEQPEAEIDDEEQLEAEIQDDDEEQPEAEIDGDNETSSEEMLQVDMNLAMRMDPETASRLKAEVKEELSDMKDHPGPSQGPGDDAGEDAV